MIGPIYYVRWTIYKIWEKKIKKPTDFIKIGRFLWFIEELVWDTAIYYLEEENEAPHKLIPGGSKSSVFGGWKAEGIMICERSNSDSVVEHCLTVLFIEL
jgi:hypothetical protein